MDVKKEPADSANLVNPALLRKLQIPSFWKSSKEAGQKGGVNRRLLNRFAFGGARQVWG